MSEVNIKRVNPSRSICHFTDFTSFDDIQNRRRAFQVLRARLMDRKLSQEVVERRDVRRNLVRSADRSEKIRTYNYAQVFRFDPSILTGSMH